MRNPDKDVIRTNLLVAGFNKNYYFPILTNFTNIYIHDFLGSIFPPLAAAGTPMDEIYPTNITYQNTVGVGYLMYFVFLGKVVINDFTYQNSNGQPDALLISIY